MSTVFVILALAVFILAIVSAAGKCPLWVPVVLAGILFVLEHLPGKI